MCLCQACVWWVIFFLSLYVNYILIDVKQMTRRIWFLIKKFEINDIESMIKIFVMKIQKDCNSEKLWFSYYDYVEKMSKR